MIERIHIVYNAADAINHFDQVGLILPSFGENVNPSEILQVIEAKHRRLYALLGSVALGDEVLGDEVVLGILNLEEDIITVEDRLGNQDEIWTCRFAKDPLPRVSATHGDLLFDLVSVDG